MSFEKMMNYATAYCTVAEVAEATLSAATETGPTIRYPTGPDTRLLTELRWTTSEAHYLKKMREMFSPGHSS